MAQKDGLLPAYLIVGSDELRRRQVLTRLKSHVASGFEDFNLDELTVTADTDPADVVASLDTLPMGPAPRIVVINPADKLPKPVSEALVTYLGNPNPSCTLALVAESLAKSTRLYKAVAKVKLRQGAVKPPADTRPAAAPPSLRPIPVELGDSLRDIGDPELRTVLESLARSLGTSEEGNS